VGVGLLLRIAAAFRAVTVTPMPASYDIALLADVADRQSRDGRPQRAIGSEDAVIPVPVFPRLWNEIHEPIEELKRRELDDAVRPGCVDFRFLPGPTQLAALCLGIT